MKEITVNGRKLYGIGNLKIIDQPGIAFVGTRQPTIKGGELFYNMANKAARYSGKTIVSGLALGCDTLAHRAALDAGVPTIAVLPCAIDTVRPYSNLGLAEEIVEKGGCLISEYAPGTPVAKWMYIKRNKLIIELSSALITGECRVKSGTMNTVTEAVKERKKIGFCTQLLCDEATETILKDKACFILDETDLIRFLNGI